MALQAFSKDEEISAIPRDQPVLVQIPGFENDNDEPEKVVPKKTSADDGVKTLQEQMDALKQANAIELKRERDQRLEAERRAETADRERIAALSSKAETETDAVAAGLAAAQAEQAAAKQALKIAGESGDWDAIGEAQARIGRSAADIREFERSAAVLAERKPDPKPDPAAAQQRPMGINEAIDGNPQLLPTERDWLKAHPEAILDSARNKELDVAYMKATRKGLSRGTPDYFKFIESEMGYESPAEENNGMSVSAPVTRTERGADGKPTGGKILLSPEERDMAKSMGVTEIEYARQKLAFEQARKADPERYK